MGTFGERAEWWWQRWVLRKSLHTTSRNRKRGLDIIHRVRWWNRGGWWGPWRTIFCVPIVRYFRTWPSRTHNTTPAHYMVMMCLGFCLPKGSVILPRAQDTPPSLFARTWDEDTGKQYFCGVLASCLEAKQTGEGSQLVDLQVDVETCVWFLHITLAI